MLKIEDSMTIIQLIKELCGEAVLSIKMNFLTKAITDSLIKNKII